MLRQRKVPKRKANPTACPLLDSTRPLRSLAHVLLGLLGVSPTRRPETTPASSNRMAHFLNYSPASQSCLRCSATPTGVGWGVFSPAGAAEHRRKNRGKCDPCSSPKRAQRDRRVGRTPVFPRSAGNPERHTSYAFLGKPSGGFLFGYFLLAAQEKVPRPEGRKEINR